MGVEYIIANLDKRELLDFDRLGFNAKLGGITSEPIASFLSWLLVNSEGMSEPPPPPRMLGRWAGDRIEIIGDVGASLERQGLMRLEFVNITIETIADYAEWMPFERITILQPMGLIDKNGAIVVDPRERPAVAAYWKSEEESATREFDCHLSKQKRIEAMVCYGAVEQVRSLGCPVTGRPLRIEFVEQPGHAPYIILDAVDSPFRRHISDLVMKPGWVKALGPKFTTAPSG